MGILEILMRQAREEGHREGLQEVFDETQEAIRKIYIERDEVIRNIHIEREKVIRNIHIERDNVIRYIQAEVRKERKKSIFNMRQNKFSVKTIAGILDLPISDIKAFFKELDEEARNKA